MVELEGEEPHDDESGNIEPVIEVVFDEDSNSETEDAMVDAGGVSFEK